MGVSKPDLVKKGNDKEVEDGDLGIAAKMEKDDDEL